MLKKTVNYLATKKKYLMWGQVEHFLISSQNQQFLIIFSFKQSFIFLPQAI